MRSFFSMLLLGSSLAVSAQIPPKPNAPGLKLFHIQDVHLLPSPFKSAENIDLKYMLAMSPDRLLAPFLREAGLAPKAQSYTNWENTGLDGHVGGHYLTALALMEASNGSKEAHDRLVYMLTELKRCQDANGDGYIGGVPGSKELWAEVFKGNVGAIGKKWVPFYNIHKTFAGLRDAYVLTGNEMAKDMFIKFGDWFVKLSTTLTPEQMQTILRTEHGGPNEELADLYALTGDKKYLTAAYSYSHQAILDPLEKKEDKLNNLHANTQIPKVIGFKRIADVSGDNKYDEAAKYFWNTVVNNRSVAIGGNSVREHFNPATDFSSMITTEQGPETCNTYNMLKLTEALFLSDPNSNYTDYYERALYNHILSSQHPTKGGFVYFTPMRPGHYRIYSQPETSMWCCVGSGMENHAKYAEMIYAHDANNLFVNLFIPSTVNWKEKGLILTQNNNFPEQESTSFTVSDLKMAGQFTIQVRYPKWVKKNGFKVMVNGKAVTIPEQANGYVAIKRVWKKGDKVSVALPMETKVERLPDNSNYEAVVHGPIVMAAEIGTKDIPLLFADDSRMGHVAAGKLLPLQNMPMFVSNTTDDAALIKPVAGQPLTYSMANLVYPEKFQSLKLIPFYKVHDNRYVIYFQKETPQSFEVIKQKLAVEEEAAAKLAAQTVDVINSGEQQPESDHFIESENSATGVTRGRHWRNAKGWFSYKLVDKNKAGATLRLTYLGNDRGKQFGILVNGKEIAKVSLDGSKGNDFYTEDYAIPADVLQAASNGGLTVKFAAADGSTTANIYEVRLLRK